MSSAARMPVTLTGARRTGRRSDSWQFVARFLANRKNLVALAVLLLMVVLALFAPLVAPHSPTEQSLAYRLRPPLWSRSGTTYILGSDQLGRDLLSRIIYGARISLFIGIASVAGASVLGTTAGLLAGYFGRIADTFIMRAVDVWMSFPFILLALAIIATLGPGLGNMVIVFTITSWMIYARVARATTLSLRAMEFVAAARVVGVSDVRIIVRHILPNLASPLIVLASFQMASMIMAEAALSFLGLGVRPPTPAWGSMIADGRGQIQEAWWISVLPGIALAITVLSINLLGDGLRDALDPQMERYAL